MLWCIRWSNPHVGFVGDVFMSHGISTYISGVSDVRSQLPQDPYGILGGSIAVVVYCGFSLDWISAYRCLSYHTYTPTFLDCKIHGEGGWCLMVVVWIRSSLTGSLFVFIWGLLDLTHLEINLGTMLSSKMNVKKGCLFNGWKRRWMELVSFSVFSRFLFVWNFLGLNEVFSSSPRESGTSDQN